MKNGLVEYPNGNKAWFLNGLLHREDGPAIDHIDVKEWWLNGLLHRENAPAVEYINGGKEWYLNGKLHREDGPAIEWGNGDKEWWLNDQLHREDGPAVIRIYSLDNKKLKKPMEEYWLNDKKITKSEWKKYKLVRELAGIKC